MSPSSQLDPVSVLIALAALVFSPNVAAVVGPYAVIWIGATLGAYWALGVREPCTRAKALRFFLAINAMAMLLTVPLAVAARPYLPAALDEQWIFGPMALGIGLVGDRWPKVLWGLVSFWRLRFRGADGDGRG